MIPKKTGLIYDPLTLLHQCGREHPERPQRVSNTIQHLESKNILAHPNIAFVSTIEPAPQQIIKNCYSKEYINNVHNLWPKDLNKTHILVLDTYVNQHTSHASDLAVGGVITATDNIMSGEWNNGFAIVRPPGHHSGFRNIINGFCIYNNVAIAAKHLQNKHGLKRILIFDWDIHHGDGTQHIFKQDESILFISLHRYDRGFFYPGKSGDFMNSGSGKAEGYQINIPWNTLDQNFTPYQDYPGDNEYIYVYERFLAPIINQFKPEFTFISAGFDSARGDPLGQLQVSPDCYYYMTKRLMDVCPKVLVALEGGYNLDSIANSVQAVVVALLGQELKDPQTKFTAEGYKEKCWLPEQYHQNIDNVITHFIPYWDVISKQEHKQYEKLIKKNKERQFGIYIKRETPVLDSEKDDIETIDLEVLFFEEIKQQKTEQKLNDI